MNNNLISTIKSVESLVIPVERKASLKPLIDYISAAMKADKPIRLNFICTHNSRRSHLSQIWAQTMANYYKVPDVICYSGGTEATAVYPQVITTLDKQGFEIIKLSQEDNSVYALKYGDSDTPIIAFSKAYDHPYNPKSSYAAIMTCNHADQNCPMIIGAEKRIPITYDDPKSFDNTDQKSAKYIERSQQIGSEMSYVFKNVSQSIS